jgi:uncharacterized membrane protein
MTEHEVNIMIVGRTKKFKYNQHCVHVGRGETIKWTLKKDKKELAFAIFVKASVSPFDWSSAQGRTEIVGTVRKDADPGYYPYGVCAVDGAELLLDDPEIIVRRP